MNSAPVRSFVSESDLRAGSAWSDMTLMTVSQTAGVIPRHTITSDPPRAIDLSKYKVCLEGDLVLNRFNAYRGALGIAPGTGIVSPDYCVLRVHANAEPRYLNYWFRANSTIHSMLQSMGGIGASDPESSGFSRVDVRSLMRERVHISSFHEQALVADFLDRETAKIDALIEKQAQLIRGLSYRREALRDHLLLQAHSSETTRPLKYAATLTVGIVVTPAAWYSDTGHIALRGTNVRDERIDTTDVVYLNDEGHYGHAKSILTAGDVVVVRTGQAGTASCVPPSLDGVNAIDLLIVKPGRELDGEYLALFLNAASTRTLTTAGSVGAIQGHFNTRSLANLDLPVPGLEEQRRLVRLWYEKRNTIDALIVKSERMIALAKERRAALITAAATGQIDVRERASREEAA